MLFKKLFIAILSVFALASCSEDKNMEIPEISTEQGNVNVTFSAGSSIELKTRAGAGNVYSGTYEASEATAQVKEYCLRKEIMDNEFLIDYLTVFVFDHEKGNLVKTVYFKDNAPSSKSVAMPTSIHEFGGIILKEGTYDFILAGNITSESITASEKTFVGYKKAVIRTDNLPSAENQKGLPMVKILEGVQLIADQEPAMAKLNLVGMKGAAVGVTNDVSTYNGYASIELERLVARIQLNSLSFQWAGVENSPSLKLTSLYLVNAGAQSSLVVSSDFVGAGGYVHGNRQWTIPGDAQANSKSMVAPFTNPLLASYAKKVIMDPITNKGNTKIWGEALDNKSSKKLDNSFYAYTRNGVLNEGDNSNWGISLVLECQLGEKTVYYYAPIQNGVASAINKPAVLANNVYNMNVVIKGDGSDTPGILKDEMNVSVSLTTADWTPVDQEVSKDPQPSV